MSDLLARRPTGLYSRLWSAGLGFLGLVLVYAMGRMLYGAQAARYARLLLGCCWADPGDVATRGRVSTTAANG